MSTAGARTHGTDLSRRAWPHHHTLAAPCRYSQEAIVQFYSRLWFLFYSEYALLPFL